MPADKPSWKELMEAAQEEVRATLDSLPRELRQAARGLPVVYERRPNAALVADGLDTSEIALRMSYSERTVKNVLHDLTTRLQLRNRTHAVAYAVREGLI